MPTEKNIREYCARHAKQIPVRETVDGLAGNYFLDELPEDLREKWHKHFIKCNRLPLRVPRDTTANTLIAAGMEAAPPPP